MEDVSIRAITIGVSVFVAIATISAVMMYYNSAKNMVQEVGYGVDFANVEDQGIREILSKQKVSGVEVRNIISYFSYKDEVTININCKACEENNTSNMRSSNIYQWPVADKSIENITQINRKIIPNYTYTLNYDASTDTITITG